MTFIFSSNMGLLNALLDLVGAEELKRSWLGSLDTALPCIAVVLIWAGRGPVHADAHGSDQQHPPGAL